MFTKNVTSVVLYDEESKETTFNFDLGIKSHILPLHFPTSEWAERREGDHTTEFW